MAFIVLEPEPGVDFNFKVDPRFHFYAESDGLTGQCKNCGEKIRFGESARVAEIEEAQIMHDCLKPILEHRERHLLFEGIQPK